MTSVETRDLYVEQFESFWRGRSRTEQSWLGDRRRHALERFETLGFPTTRMEDWRFTNISPIAGTPFLPAPDVRPVAGREQISEFIFEEPDWTEIVFINGRYAPSLSRRGRLAAGVKVASLAEVLATNGSNLAAHLGRIARYDEHAFRALNLAFVEDGALVRVSRGIANDVPVHLLFYSDARSGAPIVTHPRVLVLVEEGASVRVVETYAGLPGQVYFTNAVTEMAVGAGAAVNHYRLQREGDSAYHVSTTQVQLAGGSRFSSCAVDLGGRLVRNEANLVLDGEGIDCTLNGVYIASGEALVDNHTAVDHARPDCSSHELYKGILDGKARGVFNGKIYVRPDAQKTDSKQTNKVLLLSDDAQIDTKPQLEIYADDVKCTHGASIGQIDEEALFYLRTRGIPAAAARSLLIHAFASDVVGRIDLAPVRARLDRQLLTQLPPQLEK